MSGMADGKILADWDKLMSSVEGSYAVAVAREKDRYISVSSDEFERSKSLPDRLFFEHVAHMVGIAEKYQGIAIRLAIRAGLIKLAKSAGLRLTKEGWESLWIYLVRNWADTYGAKRAKIAASTTREDMQKVVSAALSQEEEFNPTQVAANLLKVQGLSPARSDVIARTEVHAAMMYASQEGAAKLSRDGGVEFRKRWVPVEDERTRVNHAVMANVDPIPLTSDFIVGGEAMSRPGDPRGSAANTINCRCVLTYEAAE